MTTMADRYDRAAEGYEHWWAPILAPAARGLVQLPELAGLVAERPEARILDVGTGSGTVAIAILERWPSVLVTAIDASAGMLDVARRMARRRLGRDERRLDLAKADAGDLPFSDGTFDAVVSSFVFQLVPDRFAALREARRVLRPDGLAAILAWLGEEDLFEPDEAFEDAVDALDLDFGDDPEEPRSGNFPSAAAAVAQARRAGFRAVRAIEGQVLHRHDPATYLEFLEQYAERGLFDGLRRTERARLRADARRRLERLPADAFAWRSAVLTLIGRRGR